MNRTYIVAVTAAVLLVSSVATAEVQTREIEYKVGGAVLQGLMAWNDASKGPTSRRAGRPRVVGPQRARAVSGEATRGGRLRRLCAGYVWEGQGDHASKGCPGFHGRGQEGPGGDPGEISGGTREAQAGSPRLGGPHRRHRILFRRICGPWRGAFRGRFGCSGQLPRRARDAESCGTGQGSGSVSCSQAQPIRLCRRNRWRPLLRR